MDISFIEHNTSCILAPSSNISLEVVAVLKFMLNNISDKKQIALNLVNVDGVCFEFLDFIKEAAKEKRLSLINIPAEIFALLNITKHDHFANIYLCERDFMLNKSLLKNRRFSVV